MTASYQDAEVPARIGEVLVGKYRVDRVLGVGGMGVVVAATHLQLDQLVALKFIRREAMMSHEVVSRFEREARAAVRLRSEHVARIIDVGRLDTGSPYIVMEYLEGQDLAGVIQQHGPLAVSLACDFVIQACDAIAEAHALGIVHRDLKPGNLFLAVTSHGQQTIKVLDFGISKNQVIGGDPSMTRTQAIMGSPGYMSPEQMRSSKNVDGRSDVWSLGVILYELVAGRMPFHADTFTSLCLKVAMDPHPRLSALSALPALPAAIPPGFEAALDRALEKDPARRYPSAIELARALAPFGSAQSRELAQRLGTPAAGLPPGGSLVALPAAAETTLGSAAAQARGTLVDSTRRYKRIVAGIAIGAAVMIGVAFAVTRPGDTSAVAGQPRVSEPPAAGPGSDAHAPAAAQPDAGAGAGSSIDALPPPPPPDAPDAPDADRAAAPGDARPAKPDERARPRDRRKPGEAIDPYSSPY